MELGGLYITVGTLTFTVLAHYSTGRVNISSSTISFTALQLLNPRNEGYSRTLRALPCLLNLSGKPGGTIKRFVN